MGALISIKVPALIKPTVRFPLAWTLTLFAPTFDGNSTGELAPFERYRNFGLKFSEIIDFTCA